MSTDWFQAWAAARYETWTWPTPESICRHEHDQFWQHLAHGMFWCRVCYYHRTI